ncbi:MAG: hypothetical protein J1F71_04395 [Clostridiales bacterium]|nr:hypothetical protein [Clostridiales bacterium]
MIKPDKFTDPKNCIYYNCSILLKILKDQPIISNKALHDIYLKKLGDAAESLYLPSLDFLFLLGKIEYHIDSDELELKHEIK